jgi:S-adenosylmethionine:tRNA ribosyltransferase-isomerase
VRTDDFDYDLPPRLIAQHPAQPRDSSRLMVLDRSSKEIEHAVFRELPRFLRAGDVLVLNETRVIPARLRGRKAAGGGRIEVLLLRRVADREWEVMVGGHGVHQGSALVLDDGPSAQVVEESGMVRRLRFSEPLEPYIEASGAMPLPPYITEPLRSPEEYQTIFARSPGSAAAPTAGLHFTPALLQSLDDAGVGVVYVTLHIGIDTFAPVRVADPKLHPIHREWCRLDEAAAGAIRHARSQGHRVVAVGTTTVRTLESAAGASAQGDLKAYEGWTDLLILPGHRFRAVDALVTNFHLPRSSLLMLVSAFAGRRRILAAYELAKKEGYRFYSFGDAMLVL